MKGKTIVIEEQRNDLGAFLKQMFPPLDFQMFWNIIKYIIT